MAVPLNGAENRLELMQRYQDWTIHFSSLPDTFSWPGHTIDLNMNENEKPNCLFSDPFESI